MKKKIFVVKYIIFYDESKIQVVSLFSEEFLYENFFSDFFFLLKKIFQKIISEKTLNIFIRMNKKDAKKSRILVKIF